MPTGPLAAQAMLGHHRAAHDMHPSAREHANEAIEEAIDRMYKERDAFGKRAHPIVKGVTDRYAPKRDD